LTNPTRIRKLTWVRCASCRGTARCKAVQISEPFEGLARLCRPAHAGCGKPMAFQLNPPRSTLRAGWKAEPSSQRGAGWSRASAAERQSLSAHQAAEPRVADGGIERNRDKPAARCAPTPGPAPFCSSSICVERASNQVILLGRRLPTFESGSKRVGKKLPPRAKGSQPAKLFGRSTAHRVALWRKSFRLVRIA
jgi:hypothetical protein